MTEEVFVMSENENKGMIVPINFRELEQETKRIKHENLMRDLQTEAKKGNIDYVRKQQNAVEELSGQRSSGKCYKPLHNNEIVLKWTKEQEEWWKNEDKRLKSQKELIDKMKERNARIVESNEITADIERLRNEKKTEHLNDIGFIERNETLLNDALLKKQRTKGRIEELEKQIRKIPGVYLTADKNNKILDNLTGSVLLKGYLDNNDFFRMPPNTSLFWSKCDIADIMNNEVIGTYKYFEKERVKDKVNNNGILQGLESSRTVANILCMETLREIIESTDGNPQRKIWNLASWIMAHEASGTVFMLSGAEADDVSSTWQSIELPELMRNKNVDMIVNIDLKEPEKIKKIIFPNGLKAKRLSECKFRIPQEVSALINDQVKRSVFDASCEDGFTTMEKLYKMGMVKAETKPFLLKGDICVELDKATGLELGCENFQNKKEIVERKCTVRSIFKEALGLKQDNNKSRSMIDNAILKLEKRDESRHAKRPAEAKKSAEL